MQRDRVCDKEAASGGWLGSAREEMGMPGVIAKAAVKLLLLTNSAYNQGLVRQGM